MVLLPDKIHSRTARKINETQKSVLKQSFANEPYPSKDICQKLSEQLGLKKAKVYNWFRSERERRKKRKNQLTPKCKPIYRISVHILSVIIEKKEGITDHIDLH